MTLLSVLDFVGVAVFAVSGALAAGRKQLDLLGVIVLALVTAIGGGTIRDLLLGRHPIFWLSNASYISVITAAALLTVAYARWRRPPHSALQVADALGLALFSIAGAQIAERMHLPAVSGIVLGTITGSAGGVVRDVLITEIPLVLRRGNLYATAAVAGTAMYFVLEALGVPRPVPTFVGMAVIAGLRLASILWKLQLPVFHLDPSAGKH
ncbi:MAG: trimeric intracellular cation channel family protein [Gemmatimonadaceae bacterium]